LFSPYRTDAIPLILEDINPENGDLCKSHREELSLIGFIPIFLFTKRTEQHSTKHSTKHNYSR
ncbi:MAG: hypothetical protein WA461_00345, partial [Nitrososphaeraceae archaeon]